MYVYLEGDIEREWRSKHIAKTEDIYIYPKRMKYLPNIFY